MNRLTSILTSALMTLMAAAALAQTPPITQTVGTGSNTSYFVLNFDDGQGNTDNPASDYVFAYRWDSAASPTGETLLADLDKGTAPRLTVNQTYYASFNAYFVNGFTYLSHSQTGYYNSGADQASWSYWVKDGGAWAQPQAYGVSGRSLFNGSYDGWTYHIGAGSALVPVTPSAAPEPAFLSVLLTGGVGLALMARRRRGVSV